MPMTSLYYLTIEELHVFGNIILDVIRWYTVTRSYLNRYTIEVWGIRKVIIVNNDSKINNPSSCNPVV